MGNLNTQIEKEDLHKVTVGAYGLHNVTNDSGNRFTDFVTTNNMVI